MRALVLAALVLLVAAALTLLVARPAGQPPTPPAPPSPDHRPPAPRPDIEPADSGVIYLVDPARGLLKAVRAPLPEETSPEKAVVEALISAAPSDGLTTGIPKGTQVLGVTRQDGRVTVDLNRAFADGLPAGSEAGYLTVMQVVNTVTGLEGVGEVAFEIEGKKVRALGQVDLAEPLPRDTKIIAKEED